MGQLFLFNQLGLVVSLDELKKNAEIEDIESGMGYTLNKPMMLFSRHSYGPNKMRMFKIVDFCINFASKGLPGTATIGIEASNGNVEDVDADWFINKDEAILL